MRVLLIAFSCVASLLGQATALDLIHISDTHVADFRGVHPDLAAARRSNAESYGKFESFAAEFARGPRATLVHTGDIVDAVCFDGAEGKDVYGQISLVKRALAPVRHPYYLALGNHDVECYRRDPAKAGALRGDQSVAAATRALWAKEFRFFRKRSYYSVPLRVGRTRYRLYMLDNGQSFEQGGRPFFVEQMAWLGQQLRKRPQERAIFALHIPLGEDERSRLLKEVLAQGPDKSILLCGHRHSDQVDRLSFGAREGLSVRTAAMFKGPAMWRRIRLFEDRVEIYETGPAAKVLATY